MAAVSTNPTDWLQRQTQFLLYIDGQAEATRELFLSLMGVLKGYFEARIGRGGDAEDLVQATLLKIHFARDSFDRGQSLKTWVFTIASRTLIDHWRGSAHEIETIRPSTEAPDAESLIDTLPAEFLNPEQKTQLHGDLNRALETLKPIERSIVYLYGVEGLSMAEIAQIHGLSETAVKLRAHRAYSDLRKILGCVIWFYLLYRSLK